MMGRRIAETRAGRGGTGQRREKGSSKKTDTAKNRILLTGWNLPFIPDENDIVAWVKREKNGDNKKKPRRDEEVPEEAFRHMFSRCCNLENQMEFERESLIQRYRKHCQFGPLVPEKTRPQPTEKPAAVENPQEKVPITPSGGLRYPRSCKSAEVPGTPKVSTLQQIGLGDEDIESLLPTRSHSVIDDSKLRAYGLTLPPDEKTARLLELAGKFIARADRAATVSGAQETETKPAETGGGDSTAAAAEEQQDEGYDSKISSNDADGADEDDGGSRVVQLDAASLKTTLDSEAREADHGDGASEACEAPAGWTDFSRIMAGATYTSQSGRSKPKLARPQPQTMPQYQAPTDSGRAAIAKLMYSQRDRNLYERAPNRRMRQNGFRYAGKEQSRLMETSLNHITPGYLSLHQFANLSNFMQYPIVMHDHQQQQQQQQQQQEQEQQQQLENESKQQQQQQQQENVSNTNQSSNATPSRTIAMRRICLQDSNNPDNHHFSLEAKTGSSETAAESPDQETPQGQHTPQRRTSWSSLNGNDAQSKPTDKPQGASSSNQPASSSQKHPLEDSQIITGELGSSSVSQFTAPDEVDPSTTRPRQTSGHSRDTHGHVPRHYNAPDSMVHGYPRRISQTTVPGFRSKMSGSGLRPERLSTTCFPVADLLPAVEKSLRTKGRRGLSRHHQQLLYRSQSTLLDGSIWKHTDQPVTASYPDSLDYSTSLGTPGMGGSDATPEDEMMRSPRLQFQPGESILRTAGGVSLLVHHKSHGPPGFRPHNSLSPLQRAKDIVNRRLHGHITHLPDGSETVQVASPQYQSSRMDRINSASRRLGRIINGTWKQDS